MSLIPETQQYYFTILTLIFLGGPLSLCALTYPEERGQFSSLVKWFSDFPSSWTWACLQKASGKWEELMCSSSGWLSWTFYPLSPQLSFDRLKTSNKWSTNCSHPVKEVTCCRGQNNCSALILKWPHRVETPTCLDVIWKEKPQRTCLFVWISTFRGLLRKPAYILTHGTSFLRNNLTRYPKNAKARKMSTFINESSNLLTKDCNWN